MEKTNPYIVLDYWGVRNGIFNVKHSYLNS